MIPLMATHAFKLTFSQIACTGCGTPRIRGITCPDCGHAPQPWEVDEAGLKRRETAARAQVLLEQPVTAPPPPERLTPRRSSMLSSSGVSGHGWTSSSRQ